MEDNDNCMSIKIVMLINMDKIIYIYIFTLFIYFLNHIFINKLNTIAL